MQTKLRQETEDKERNNEQLAALLLDAIDLSNRTAKADSNAKRLHDLLFSMGLLGSLAENPSYVPPPNKSKAKRAASSSSGKKSKKQKEAMIEGVEMSDKAHEYGDAAQYVSDDEKPHLMQCTK